MFIQLPLLHGFGIPQELHMLLDKNATFTEVQISGKMSCAESKTWNNFVCVRAVSFGTVRVDSRCEAAETRPLW